MMIPTGEFKKWEPVKCMFRIPVGNYGATRICGHPINGYLVGNGFRIPACYRCAEPFIRQLHWKEVMNANHKTM